MSSNPPASIPPPPDGLSPSVVEEIIRQSAQQLEVKRRELELQQQNQANQDEYAKAALAAQSEDLKDTRKHDASRLTRRLVFSAFSGNCRFPGVLHTGREGPVCRRSPETALLWRRRDSQRLCVRQGSQSKQPDPVRR